MSVKEGKLPLGQTLPTAATVKIPPPKSTSSNTRQRAVSPAESSDTADIVETDLFSIAIAYLRDYVPLPTKQKERKRLLTQVELRLAKALLTAHSTHAVPVPVWGQLVSMLNREEFCWCTQTMSFNISGDIPEDFLINLQRELVHMLRVAEDQKARQQRLNLRYTQNV